MASIDELLINELFSVKGYLKRLNLQMASRPFDQPPLWVLRIQSEIESLNTLLVQKGYLPKFGRSRLLEESCHVTHLNQKLVSLVDYFSQSLELLHYDKNLGEVFVVIVNQAYSIAQKIHFFLDPENLVQIALPRVGLIQIQKGNEKGKIPLFYLSRNALETLESGPFSFHSIEKKRSENYQQFINWGREKLLQKNYVDALDYFNEALKLSETAEVLTLLGWCHSLQNNLIKAKEFCLKAIRLKPNQGDAYNDYGSYLLLEGQVKESLEWFSQAKKAPLYEKRELPFINSGKAYLLLKDFHQAYEEFQQAMRFVPYNQELKETLEKLEVKLQGPAPITLE